MEAVLLLRLEERQNPAESVGVDARRNGLRTDRTELERRADAAPRTRVLPDRRRHEAELATAQRRVLDAEVGLDGRQRPVGQRDEEAAETAVRRADDALAHLRREQLAVDVVDGDQRRQQRRHYRQV